MTAKFYKKSGETLQISDEVFETTVNIFCIFHKQYYKNIFQVLPKLLQKSGEFLQISSRILAPYYFTKL